MVGGEGGVKGLDAERGGIARESLGMHERDGAETADISVVDGATIIEPELDRRVRALAFGQVPVIDEQRASEARLNNESVSTGQVEDDELGATPAALDDGAGRATIELSR